MIYHDGWYYLLGTRGSCCAGPASGYNIRVGRSRKVTGPFLDNTGVDMIEGGGKLFLGSGGRLIGPGHFGLLDLGDTAAQKFSMSLGSRPRSWRGQRARHSTAAVERRLAGCRRKHEGRHLRNRIRPHRHLARTRRGGSARRRRYEAAAPVVLADAAGVRAHLAEPPATAGQPNGTNAARGPGGRGPGGPGGGGGPGRGCSAALAIPFRHKMSRKSPTNWPAGNIDVRMANYMLQAQQKWTVAAVTNAGGYPGSPYFKITIAGTDRALAATADGELVALTAFTGAPEQLWRLDQLTDGTWRIMPKSNSKEALAISAIGSSSATLEKFNPESDRQRWLFKNP